MTSRYEEIPLTLREDLTTRPPSYTQSHGRSFDEEIHSSFDSPRLERLSSTLITPKGDGQTSQSEMVDDSSAQSRKIPVDPQRRSFASRSGSWWWWEIGSVILSLCCSAAIVTILASIHGKSLSSWAFLISPNALISVFATVSKATLMLSVAACISQMKWLHFRLNNQLNDLQIFDDASRGPYGALGLLTRTSRDVSVVSLTATLGSIVTILALALDPFAQQILSFPTRNISLKVGSGSILATQIYDTGNPGGVTDSQGKNVDVSMQGAIMNGLYSLDSPVKFTCQTANCTWPTFYSLGMCSSCTNVTSAVNGLCEHSGASQSCNFTLPSGTELFADYRQSSGGGYRTTFNSSAVVVDTGYSTNITNTLVDIAMIKMAYNYDEKIGTVMRPDATQCSLVWCAKSYRNTTVSNGILSVSDISTYELQSFSSTYDSDGRGYNTFTLADGNSGIDWNRTFTINYNDHNTISSYLADFFTTSDQDATARALTLSPNIPQTIANIATSMTNNIRQGVNATASLGTATTTEAYIHVNWNWLLLPLIVVVTGVLLLIFSIVLNLKSEMKLWKSSSLALLFSQLQGWNPIVVNVGSPTQLNEAVDGMKGKLAEDGELKFVNTRLGN